MSSEINIPAFIIIILSVPGDFMNIKIHGCVGGTAVREDMRILQDGVHIVVGTPGKEITSFSLN